MIMKLLKNWIFTLVMSVILIGFGIVMFVNPGDIMNILIASGIVVYIALVLVDNVVHYRGKIQIFAGVELIIMAILALCLLTGTTQFFDKIGIKGVNATVGFAMWLRAFIELIHGYYIRASVNKGQFSLLRLVIYVAFLTFGVALMASPVISDKFIQIFVGVSAVFGGVVMAILTYQNRKLKRDNVKVIDEKPLAETPESSPDQSE